MRAVSIRNSTLHNYYSLTRLVVSRVSVESLLVCPKMRITGIMSQFDYEHYMTLMRHAFEKHLMR